MGHLGTSSESEKYANFGFREREGEGEKEKADKGGKMGCGNVRGVAWTYYILSSSHLTSGFCCLVGFASQVEINSNNRWRKPLILANEQQRYGSVRKER